MIRSSVAIVMLLLSAVGAQAQCVSRPDNADSHYVENQTALSLCLQRELGRTTDAAAMRAQIDAMLGNMQIQIERQRQQQLQRLSSPTF